MFKKHAASLGYIFKALKHPSLQPPTRVTYSLLVLKLASASLLYEQEDGWLAALQEAFLPWEPSPLRC